MMIFRFTFLAIIGFAPALQAIDYSKCMWDDEIDNTLPVHKELPEKDDLTFKDLMSLISKKDIKSIDELVPYLKNNRKNWTAMYDSNSPQEDAVSCANPRIISIGRGRKLLLAWVNCIGDEDLTPFPKCEQIEALEIDGVDSKLYKASLPGKHHRDLKPPQPIANDQKCLQCHGNPPLPIFEAYNSWHGAFGSASRSDNDLIAKNSEEEKCYKEFLNNSKGGKAPARFEKLAFDRKRRLYSGPGDVDVIKHSTIQDPNSYLTEVAEQQATSSIASHILKSPQFEKFRFAFTAMALRTVLKDDGCLEDAPEDFDKFFPEEMQRGKKDFMAALNDTVATLKKDHRNNKREQQLLNPMTGRYQPIDPLAGFDPKTVGKKNWKLKNTNLIFEVEFEYLLKQMKSPLRRWSFGQRRKYDIDSGKTSYAQRLSKKLLSALASCDPEIKKITENPIRQCEILAEKSQEALKDFYQPLGEPNKKPTR